MNQTPLNILCVEPSFPGRLGATADWLVSRRGYRCRFYCVSTAPRSHWPASVGRGLEVVTYKVGGVAREPVVAWTRLLERSLCYAYGAWEALDGGRQGPVDLVLGRSAGLGSTLFVTSWQPRVPVVNLFDHYLHAREHDLADHHDDAGAGEPPNPERYFHWRRASHAVELLDLENGVTPWTPTAWQRDQFPAEYRDDFVVAFDGVEPRRAARAGGPRAVAGRSFPAGTKVVSFAASGLDRLRGFDRFARLADALLRARSDVVCVAAGGPVVRRGLDVHFYGKDYPAHLAATAPVHDPSRFLTLGDVGPGDVADLLDASDLHVDPSRTYAVARSIVGALAAGRVVLGWDTPPLREFVTHGVTGLLVDPADPDDAARAALGVLDDPAGHRPLGEAARALARERFTRDAALPALADLFARLAGAPG